MTVILLGVLVFGFLAGRVRYGWIAIPLILVMAPYFWTAIGAFDDGESWLLRAVMGPMFAIPAAVGWLAARRLGQGQERATLSPAS
jgi:hypothetical protein